MARSVRSLIVARSHIRHVDTNKAKHMRRLLHLSLRDNKITTAHGFARFPALNSLVLARNRIVKVRALDDLPPSLRRLDLAHNRIRTLIDLPGKRRK